MKRTLSLLFGKSCGLERQQGQKIGRVMMPRKQGTGYYGNVSILFFEVFLFIFPSPSYAEDWDFARQLIGGTDFSRVEFKGLCLDGQLGVKLTPAAYVLPSEWGKMGTGH
jgi:hypothetical protein